MKCNICRKDIKDHSDRVQVMEIKKLWKHWIFGWDHRIIRAYHSKCYHEHLDPSEVRD